MSTKDERHRQLGMNPSTAASALKKDIMFSLIKRLDEDICYQCGKRIETVKELSVEHKTPWLHTENPKETFFDLGNIAFSHLSCNSRAARSPTRGTTKYPELIGASESRSPSKVANDRRRTYCPKKRKAQYKRTGR